MVGLRSVIVAAVAATASMSCLMADLAEAGSPSAPTYLLFAGTDLWRYGVFVYGGLLWSPAGLDSDGFTFKALLDGGGYTYRAGAFDRNVDGTLLTGSLLPGWRFSRGAFAMSLFAGVTVQDYRLHPNDPSSHLNGTYAGAQFAADVWYQPTASTMTALNATISTVGPTESVRAALGERVFERMFVGPEAEAIWCRDFEELQFGAHITGFHTGTTEWSAGGGWAMDSERRSGPYWRFGVNARY